MGDMPGGQRQRVARGRRALRNGQVERCGMGRWAGETGRGCLPIGSTVAEHGLWKGESRALTCYTAVRLTGFGVVADADISPGKEDG